MATANKAVARLARTTVLARGRRLKRSERTNLKKPAEQPHGRKWTVWRWWPTAWAACWACSLRGAIPSMCRPWCWRTRSAWKKPLGNFPQLGKAAQQRILGAQLVEFEDVAVLSFLADKR